jgi:phage-related tail fiber protein
MMEKRDQMMNRSRKAGMVNMATKRKAAANIGGALDDERDQKMLRGAGKAYDKATKHAKGGKVKRGYGCAIKG